jgi:hypothetical protein
MNEKIMDRNDSKNNSKRNSNIVIIVAIWIAITKKTKYTEN